MKEFRAESKKLLDLVVNSIYTNREIFLRELISNASDALDKRRFMSLTDASLDAPFGIELIKDKTKRTLTVSDNGVGMDADELENNLGVIAASGTEAFKRSQENKDAENLIGQFGVGFYSAFMVADRVTVISRRVGTDKTYKWESDGINGFEVSECADRGEYGTTVTLELKADGDEDYSQYLDEYKLRGLVRKYSDYIHYPVRMEMPKAANDSGVTVGEMTTVNSMTPVWKKSKSDLGENELNDFYKRTFREYRDPIHTVSTRVEGAVNYTALLFVPAEPAAEYYTKDFKHGLALYSNGVMIMEKCSELIPEYLGFVHGVVDTPDLALNISRETLQHDRRVRAICSGLEKKLLSEFTKLLKSDREKYDKLFTAFSKAIKFGAYQNFGADKDKLKDLLLYYSDSEKKHITFAEYCAKLQKDEPILYACGETAEKISMLPQLEGARENGRDVLYFVDAVDEFIVRMLETYDGHKFENIASGSSEGAVSDSHEALLKRIEERLKGKAAVCATDKLKSYPVCLAAKGEVSLEMERIMDAMGGGIKAERVLQVNLAHPVIKGLETADASRFNDTVTVLYNEALLAEGYRTEPEFLSALNRLLAAPCEDEAAVGPAEQASETGEETQKPKKPRSSTAKKSSTTKKSTAAKKSTQTKKPTANKSADE